MGYLSKLRVYEPFFVGVTRPVIQGSSQSFHTYPAKDKDDSRIWPKF